MSEQVDPVGLERSEIQRWTVSRDLPDGMEPDSLGSWVDFSEHLEIVVNLEHERKFWAWKFSRREAECEELADRLTKAESDLAALQTSHNQTGELLVYWKERFESLQARVSGAENNIAEALHWLRGGDAEAAEAALVRDGACDRCFTTQPVSPEPTPEDSEAVEVLAKRLFDREMRRRGVNWKWDDLTTQRKGWEDEARLHLTAITPLLPGLGEEEQGLRRRLELALHHEFDLHIQTCRNYERTDASHYAHHRSARAKVEAIRDALPEILLPIFGGKPRGALSTLNLARFERICVLVQETGREGDAAFLRDLADRPVRFESQHAMRFGPRSYTPEQAATIAEAVRTRQPLSTRPLPLDDSPDRPVSEDPLGELLEWLEREIEREGAVLERDDISPESRAHVNGLSVAYRAVIERIGQSKGAQS